MKLTIIKSIDRFVGSFLVRCLPAVCGRGEGLPVLRQVLFIRPGGIGDAVLLIPAILDFKAMCPEATITVLAEKRNAAVFALSPAVDRVLLYDRRLDLLNAIRSRYDAVIDTEQWHRFSALVARASKAPVTVGFATNERQKLFTHRIAYSHDDYELESFRHLLVPLGVKARRELAGCLAIPAAAQESAENLLSSLGGAPFAVLFPGASIPERRWGKENFRRLSLALLHRGITVVVVGGGADVADADFIVAGTAGITVAGRTSLLVTAAIISRACVLVTGDSGILHLGIALDRPTVSLFGPGIRKKWAPRRGSHRVIDLEFPCSPCTRFGTTPPCPLRGRCIGDIDVPEVLAAVEEVFWAEKKSPLRKNP